VTTAIDSNILIALWNEDDALNTEAAQALQAAAGRGALVIAAPVYVELRTLPDRDERAIDGFLRITGIDVDWRLEEKIWREAAKASHEYATRRRGERHSKLPRRIAGDFIIGAHAMVRDYSLLTLDRRTFRIAFPSLHLAPEGG
jgi:predicted nucleic acid-binding protein